MMHSRSLRTSFAPWLVIVTTCACGGASEADPPIEDPAVAQAGIIEPIAEAAAEWNGHVTQILDLARIDVGVLELRFAIVNRDPDGAPTEFGDALGRGPGDEGSVADVYLLDTQRQKKYFVLRDEDGRALCSRELAPLASGDRVELWARFPAPPDEVSAIDVAVPHTPIFTGVPIRSSPSNKSATAIR